MTRSNIPFVAALAALACGLVAVKSASGDAQRTLVLPPATAPDIAADEPEKFAPDVYAWFDAAMEEAVRRWAKDAERDIQGRSVTVVIHCPDRVVETADKVQSGIKTIPYYLFATTARVHLPNVGYYVDRTTKGPAGAPPAGEVWVAIDLQIDERTQRTKPVVYGTSGAVRITARGETTATSQVRFRDVAWLNPSEGEFIDSLGDDTKWIIVQSKTPSPTADEASDRARAAAIDRLAEVVRARIVRKHHVNGRLPEDWLRQRLEAELIHGRFVADRFAQKFERPYGPVWTEAMLVDASDSPQMREFCSNLVDARSLEQGRRRNAFLSAGALLLVVYALYRVANGFTRGYFTWSLRTAAAAAAAGAVVLIVAVA